MDLISRSVEPRVKAAADRQRHPRLPVPELVEPLVSPRPRAPNRKPELAVHVEVFDDQEFSVPLTSRQHADPVAVVLPAVEDEVIGGLAEKVVPLGLELRVKVRGIGTNFLG